MVNVAGAAGFLWVVADGCPFLSAVERLDGDVDGVSMAYQWRINGVSMAYPWRIYGVADKSLMGI